MVVRATRTESLGNFSTCWWWWRRLFTCWPWRHNDVMGDAGCRWPGCHISGTTADRLFIEQLLSAVAHRCGFSGQAFVLTSHYRLSRNLRNFLWRHSRFEVSLDRADAYEICSPIALKMVLTHFGSVFPK